MRRWLEWTSLVCLLSACDVATVREAADAVAHNQCQRNEDCDGGDCVDEQCRSRTSTFQTVLFEVMPPADNSVISGVQFLKEVSGLTTEVGDPLDLGVISQVAGRVTAELLKCPPTFFGDAGAVVLTAHDSSLPARVSLIPAASALGLYAPRAVVQSSIVDDVSWAFSANVPPGTYDIYVEPNRQPDASCPVPPLLRRGQVIKEGNVPLDILLPEPSRFEFHVTWLGEGTLSGWMVDMLDRATGRAISNRVPLAPGPGGKTDYVANVPYNSVSVVSKGMKQQDDQWVRLSPPDDAAASLALPTVLLSRSALGLFSAGRGTLSNFTSLPTAVHLHGQVTSGNTPVPAAATVTLAAKKITGIDPGVLASLVRTVKVGADGQFEVDLLPGTYRVSTYTVVDAPQRGHGRARAHRRTHARREARDEVGDLGRRHVAVGIVAVVARRRAAGSASWASAAAASPSARGARSSRPRRARARRGRSTARRGSGSRRGRRGRRR